MCLGILAIGIIGCLLDLVLLVAAGARERWADIFVLLLHFAYSVVVIGLAGPILRLHIGFIARNELANDWKKNTFYIIHSKRTGGIEPVNDLGDEEFNERFDSFVYDGTRNPWDKGIFENCFMFWCTPRWMPSPT